MSKSPTITASRSIPVGGLAQMRRAPTHPGEIFREEFRIPSGLKGTDVAARLGMSVNRLSEIELGKRGVTPETAVLFEAITGSSAEFWCGLQLRHDLWHAMKDPVLAKRAKTVERFTYPKAEAATRHGTA